MKSKFSKFKLYGLLLLAMQWQGGEAQGMNDKKDEDYLWLEDLESEKALSWVRKENERSLQKLRATPHYASFKQEALTILQAQDKIPYGRIQGDYVLNFWQDAKHVRGIWRRSPWADYVKGQARWETLVDVDALGAQDGKSYVFGGSRCLEPTYTRCLIRLSEGGSDASAYREFDMKTKTFVKDGFALPASKSSLTWLDENTVFFNNALDEKTQTSSGYPMETRLWKRGQALKDAPLLFQGQKSDVAVDSLVVHDGKDVHAFAVRALSFYTAEIHAYQDGKFVKLALPLDIELKGLYRGQLLISNRTPLAGFKAGSLLSTDYASLLKKGQADYQLVFAPSDRQALAGSDRGLDYFYVTVLDEVRSKVYRFEYKAVSGKKAEWASELLPLEDKGTIGLMSVDEQSNRLLLNYEDFLTPESLFAVDGQAKTKTLVTQVPPRFKADGLIIRQEFATSRDGTKVPYFLVHRSDIELKGQQATLLYGYGGFEVSLQPGYSEVMGKLWLEKGGVYALANIRGGGEFGPTWHQAALLGNRQKAFDDFAAVAEDMIKKKITSAEHLGIQGGSNGGLLMGASFTQRPELFKAVICQVPLLDMLRYHKLLAGASWMAEYGNPEDAKMAPILRSYSPFQNLDSKKEYPEVFFVTSTKDDRVHPGHARKMAARMADMKKPFYYYENIEGGHSASADLLQAAERSALEYSYLWMKLKPQPEPSASKAAL